MSWESQWQIYWHSRCKEKCNNTFCHLNITLLGPNWSTCCPYKTSNSKKLNTTMLPGWQHCKLLQMTSIAYYTLLLNMREVMMKTIKVSHLEGFTPDMSWLYSQPFFSLCKPHVAVQEPLHETHSLVYQFELQNALNHTVFLRSALSYSSLWSFLSL